MSYYTELDLPELELYDEFNKLMDNGTIHWFRDDCQDQICINSTKKDPDNFLSIAFIKLALNSSNTISVNVS